MQHLLLHQLNWLLLIYELLMTTVAKLEQRMSNAIQKWLPLHNSATNICLYSTTPPWPLPTKSLTSITKSAKLRGQLLLWESSDPFVSSASVSLNAGKLTATDAVASAETRLVFKKIMGYHQYHKGGFGAVSTPQIPAENIHAFWKLLSLVQEESDEGKILARTVQLKLWGPWTNLVGVISLFIIPVTCLGCV